MISTVEIEEQRRLLKLEDEEFLVSWERRKLVLSDNLECLNKWKLIPFILSKKVNRQRVGRYKSQKVTPDMSDKYDGH